MKCIFSMLMLLCCLKLAAQDACGTSTPNTSTTNPHNTATYSFSTSNYNPNAKYGPLYFDWTDPNTPIRFYYTSGASSYTCNLISPFFTDIQNSNTNLCVAPNTVMDGGPQNRNTMMYGSISNSSTYSGNFTNITERLKEMDVLPEDGWEILKHNFGRAPDPFNSYVGCANSMPYFVLYNRYTGKLKVFAAALSLSANSTNNTSAFVQVSISGATKYLLFQHVSPIITAMKDLPTNATFLTTTPNDIMQAITSPGSGFHYYWMYAETNISYDPCVCRGVSQPSPTSMNIDIFTSVVSNVNLTMDGVANPIGPGSSGNNNSVYVNNQLNAKDNMNVSLSDLSSLTGSAKAALAGYKKFSEYADAVEDYYKSTSSNGTSTNNYVINNTANLYLDATGQGTASQATNVATFNTIISTPSTATGAIKKMGGFSELILEGSKALPYIGAFISLVDYLDQGGKESNPAATAPPAAPPTTYQLQANITGTISSQSWLAGGGFYVPGSKPNHNFSIVNQANECGAGINYPIYNNPLGVFSVLEMPEFEFKNIPLSNNGIDPNIGGGFTFRSMNDPGITMQNGGSRLPFQVYDYKLRTPLKYVVNPSANVTVQSINCAFVLEYTGTDALYSQTNAYIYLPITANGNLGGNYAAQKQIPYYPGMFSYYYGGFAGNPGVTSGNSLHDIMTNKLPSTGFEPEYQSGTYTNADGTNPADAIMRVRTKYVPIQALQNLDFIMLGGGTNKPKLYIKLYVKLTRNDKPDAEPVTMVLTYDASTQFNAATSAGTGGSCNYYYYYAQSSGNTATSHAILSSVQTYGAYFTPFYGIPGTTISTPQQTGIVASGSLNLPNNSALCASSSASGYNTFSTTGDFNVGDNCTLEPVSAAATLSIAAAHNIGIGNSVMIGMNSNLYAGNDIIISPAFTVGSGSPFTVNCYAGDKIMLINNVNISSIANIEQSNFYANNEIALESPVPGTEISIHNSVLSTKPGTVPNIYGVLYNYDVPNAQPVTAFTESVSNIQLTCTAANEKLGRETDHPLADISFNEANAVVNAVKNPSRNMSVGVFPNPTAANVHVSYALLDAKYVTITMDDITGKQVINRKYHVSVGNNDHEIDMQQLSNGVYILKMIDDKGSLVKTEKIILNR